MAVRLRSIGSGKSRRRRDGDILSAMSTFEDRVRPSRRPGQTVGATMPADESFIAIHAAAPPKAALGAPCNGCGVCCAALPCPLSRLLLGHRHGACPALTWEGAARRYVCGMVTQPARFLRWLPRRWSAFAGRRCARWIAAGRGCDSVIEVL